MVSAKKVVKLRIQKSIGLVYDGVPIWLRWTIGTGCLVPVIGYIVVQFVSGHALDVSWSNVAVLGGILLALATIGFVIGALRALSKSQEEENVRKEKRILPSRYISIGAFNDSKFSADLQAEIVLEESLQPSADIFLTRISHGKPYCPQCSITADIKRASWMADGVPIGYCNKCGRDSDKAPEEFLRELHGFVRMNFAELWERYSKAIGKITRNRPEEYLVSIGILDSSNTCFQTIKYIMGFRPANNLSLVPGCAGG